MKKVWVNRFNSDGGMKPMTEWINIVCNGEDTHAIVSDEYIAPFSGDYPIESFVHSNGLFCEYISNQRGDGWFYVADGDLPPACIDEVFVNFYDGGFGVALNKDIRNLELNEVIQAWQPIMPLKAQSWM